MFHFSFSDLFYYILTCFVSGFCSVFLLIIFLQKTRWPCVLNKENLSFGIGLYFSHNILALHIWTRHPLNVLQLIMLKEVSISNAFTQLYAIFTFFQKYNKNTHGKKILVKNILREFSTNFILKWLQDHHSFMM